MTTKIAATFSNGLVDTYKGDRDVKAAWMITAKSTGEVLRSGHSMDREKAAKTAAGYVSQCGGSVAAGCPEGEGQPFSPVRGQSGYNKRWAKELGYTGPNSTSAVNAYHRDRNARINALRAARVTVEIVDC